MRILILLLILPILLLLCALTVYRAPLPALDGSRDLVTRDLVAALAVGLLGVGYLAGLVIYVVFVLHRAGRALDPALTRWGLVSAWAPPFGQGYTGVVDGRTVQVTYRSAVALQPASLDVIVRIQQEQRLVVSSGPQRPLLDCRDCLRLEIPARAGVYLYAEDEARARALLARPEAQTALDHLFNRPGLSGSRDLYLQPDRVWLRARLRMPGNDIAAWLDDLLPALVALAQASERL